MPEEDEKYKTLSELKDKLAMIMGGYVTEKKIYGDDSISTGPSNDLKKATQIATKMIKEYGMSNKLAPRKYGTDDEEIFLAQEMQEGKNYSEDTATEIDKEINALLIEARDRAMDLITQKKEEMEELVKTLMEKETVEQDEFVKIMNGESILEDKDSGEKASQIENKQEAEDKENNEKSDENNKDNN